MVIVRTIHMMGKKKQDCFSFQSWIQKVFTKIRKIISRRLQRRQTSTKKEVDFVKVHQLLGDENLRQMSTDVRALPVVSCLAIEAHHCDFFRPKIAFSVPWHTGEQVGTAT